MGHRVPYLPKVGRPAVIWDKEETGTAADKLTPSDIGIIYSDCMSRSYALTNCEALGSGGYGVLQKARVLHSKTFQDTELEKKFKDQGHQMVIYFIYYSRIVWGAVCNMHTFVDRSNFVETEVQNVTFGEWLRHV